MNNDDLSLPLDDSFARELEGCHVPWRGDAVPKARLVMYNRPLAENLGLPAELESEQGAEILCGARPPHGVTPVAQLYAGHQFGHFSPQLGDGRALLLGEIVTPRGDRFDLHLKGSGPTPFARNGDGKATLGPMLREYLVSEAMHALGIPTTRALAVVGTGERVLRGPMYQPGAVLARVAASHIRVGTFQYFAAHGDLPRLKRLVDYTIARHDPDLTGEEDRHAAFLERVIERQSELVARWMAVGFIHGVMNTDNMALSGETIDYGPCAFMDRFAPATVFSSIDHQGRYAWKNQPLILQWNLARLAETLLPFLDDDQDRAIGRAEALIAGVAERYRDHWLRIMAAKLGLEMVREGDQALIDDLLDLMHRERADFTLTLRHLAAAVEGDEAPFREQFAQHDAPDDWLQRWQARLAEEPRPAPLRRAAMEARNPLYIPRNHLVEAALAAAVEGDLAPFERLLAVLSDPFTLRPGLEEYSQPAPEEFTARYRTFCGT